MPNDLLIYEIYDVQQLLDRGILKPLGGYRYQFTQDYVHNPKYSSPTKAHLKPMSVSDVWKANTGNIIFLLDMSGVAPMVQKMSDQGYAFQFDISSAYTAYYGNVTIGGTVPADTTGTLTEAPTASAGDDRVVSSVSQVQLIGVGSDVATNMLEYTWLQLSGPTVTLLDSTSRSASFISPSVVAVQDLVFQFTVSNGYKSASDTVTVTVLP